MDWKKAKNIIIAALLICDLVLLGYLLSGKIADKKMEKALGENAKQYAQSLGVQVNCDFPRHSGRLPMLLINYLRGEGIGDAQYKGIPIVWSGELAGISPEVDDRYYAKATLRCSGEAAIELLSQWIASGETVEGQSIDSVTLVYWFDASNTGTILQNTAVPCWQFSTSLGNFYISALSDQE